jgi:hypothetical protein
MDELQIKCTALGQQNARLLSHVAVVESQKNMLVQQVGAPALSVRHHGSERWRQSDFLLAGSWH